MVLVRNADDLARFAGNREVLLFRIAEFVTLHNDMDIELLDNQAILSGLRFPFKVSKVTQVVIARGEASCIVDFYSYTLRPRLWLSSCQARSSSP